MKTHMKNHTYQKVSQKCQECDLLGDSQYTMHVHHGKEHLQNFQCGLCDVETKTLEELELHLFTCQIYKCMKCHLQEKTLNNIKKHIKECSGTESGFFYHQKMDRIRLNEVSDKSYILRPNEEEPHAW